MDSMGWIDCTQPLRVGLPQPPGMPEYACQTTRDIQTDRFNMQQLRVLTHHGTHVDAPFHFIRDGETIEQVGLSTLTGAGIVVELPRGELGAITAADLAPFAADLPGAIVLIRTGWSIHYGDEAYMRGPFLTAEAAGLLQEHGAKLVGVDLLSPDEPPHAGRAADFDYPVHRMLLGAGIPIIENLNLEAVRGHCEVLALPIPVVGGDGAPARVVARRRAGAADSI